MLNRQRELTPPRPHCASHYHQLRVFLTLHFLWHRPTAMVALVMAIAFLFAAPSSA